MCCLICHRENFGRDADIDLSWLASGYHELRADGGLRK
jgi:hypothetical protein